MFDINKKHNTDNTDPGAIVFSLNFCHSSHVIWASHLLKFSISLYIHLKNGNNNSNYLKGVLLSEVMHIKHLE